MAVQSNEVDQHSSEGESGTSSSRTAQDENGGVSGVEGRALNKEVSEKDERGTKSSNDHQKEGRSSLSSLLHHNSEKRIEHEQQPSHTSSMSRTINTVPGECTSR